MGAVLESFISVALDLDIKKTFKWWHKAGVRGVCSTPLLPVTTTEKSMITSV